MQDIERKIDALRMAMEALHAQIAAIKPNAGQRYHLVQFCTAYTTLDGMRAELEKQRGLPAIAQAA